MNPRNLIFIVFLFCCFTTVKSQCNFSQVDKFENIWIIDGQSVICFDKNFKRTGEYSNIQLGQPTILDVTNPLKVLVFFSSSQVIIFLDKKVSQISSPIFLKSRNFVDVGLVCRSIKGGIWIFDSVNKSLVLCDENANPTSFRIPVGNDFTTGRPIFMQEQSSILYMAFSKKEIVRYNEFGQFVGTIPISTDFPFQISDSALYYLSNNHLNKFLFDENTHTPMFCECCNGCLPIVIRNQVYTFNGKTIVPCK